MDTLLAGNSAEAGDRKAKLTIGVLIPQLGTGAVATAMIRVADGLAAAGHKVVLLSCGRKRAVEVVVPDRLPHRGLTRSSGLRSRLAAIAAMPAGALAALLPYLVPFRLPLPAYALPALTDYLRSDRPDVLLAALTGPSIAAVQARRACGVATRIVVTEHSTIGAVEANDRPVRAALRRPLLRWMLREADALVTVSKGAAGDVVAFAKLPAEAVTCIYEPAVTGEMARAVSLPCPHPWLDDPDVPVVLGCGRLAPQKDFATLVRAFAQLRERRRARLVILGEGRGPAETSARKAELMALAAGLGVVADIDLPGHVANPMAWMARSAVFALSSTYEGFAMVVAEALAAGCPVVSTDCPHGPAEILDGGRWGRLVPVGDAPALAAALAATLDGPPDRAALRRRGAEFSVDAAVRRYDRLLSAVVSRAP